MSKIVVRGDEKECMKWKRFVKWWSKARGWQASQTQIFRTMELMLEKTMGTWEVREHKNGTKPVRGGSMHADGAIQKIVGKCFYSRIATMWHLFANCGSFCRFFGAENIGSHLSCLEPCVHARLSLRRQCHYVDHGNMNGGFGALMKFSGHCIVVNNNQELFNPQLIPAWTRLSLALLKADLISSEEFRHRKETGVEYAKELVRLSTGWSIWSRTTFCWHCDTSCALV